MRRLACLTGVALACAPMAQAQEAVVKSEIKLDIEGAVGKDQTLVGQIRFASMGEDDDPVEYVYKIDPRKTYWIYGACEEDCGGINVAAFDERGIELAGEEDESEPVVAIDANWTKGTLKVKVSMYRCSADTCIAGVGLFEQQ